MAAVGMISPEDAIASVQSEPVSTRVKTLYAIGAISNGCIEIPITCMPPGPAPPNCIFFPRAAFE